MPRLTPPTGRASAQWERIARNVETAIAGVIRASDGTPADAFRRLTAYLTRLDGPGKMYAENLLLLDAVQYRLDEARRASTMRRAEQAAQVELEPPRRFHDSD